jgi:hypothetical protein
LRTGGRAKTGSFALALQGDAQFGDLAPRDDRPGTKRSIVALVIIVLEKPTFVDTSST